MHCGLVNNAKCSIHFCMPSVSQDRSAVPPKRTPVHSPVVSRLRSRSHDDSSVSPKRTSVNHKIVSRLRARSHDQRCRIRYQAQFRERTQGHFSAPPKRASVQRHFVSSLRVRSHGHSAAPPKQAVVHSHVIVVSPPRALPSDQCCQILVSRARSHDLSSAHSSVPPKQWGLVSRGISA
jgi:hypothetical protein